MNTKVCAGFKNLLQLSLATLVCAGTIDCDVTHLKGDLDSQMSIPINFDFGIVLNLLSELQNPYTAQRIFVVANLSISSLPSNMMNP